MDTVGPERERGLDVVVDDEREPGLAAERVDGAADLDQLIGRGALAPQLDHGCTGVARLERPLRVLDERVEPHASPMRARPSSVAGSSAASAS